MSGVDLKPIFFHKVLVANRGEIARRIFRTLREMGLESVAIYSDADRDAPHVAEADEAVCLGANDSYLDQNAVIAAAQAVGADAIHPGYGFLAENAQFAELCDEAALIFIGPSSDAMRCLGNKAEAKALAVKVGVPVLDGFSLTALDRETIRSKAEELGFPLLIKAVAGGGGKGMRAVENSTDLDDALAAAAREAEASFGDAALLVEPFVATVRHVEVQIFGDAHGHVVHLFERDCSLQRRHQKVFEESPSPAVDAEMRKRLGAAAVALARAVSYRGAGTVEFLLEASGAFYFLEMNTRLQVEHPVTEAITGLDLVRLQIEVAQGLPLGFDQSELELSGHAIEARLYAEDPQNDFLPATGTVTLWTMPTDLPGLRIDSGIEQGSRIGIHYDPMLAKVIAHGQSREEALRRLHRGLSELAVGGLTTNREFLLAVLEHDAFRRGEVDTAFLQRLPVFSRTRSADPEVVELHAIAATLQLFHDRRQRASPVPAGVPPGWRNNRWRPQEQAFEHGTEHLTIRYLAHEHDRFTLEVASANTERGMEPEPRQRPVRLISAGDGLLVAEVDSVRRRFRIGTRSPDSSGLAVHGLGRVSDLKLVPRFPERHATTTAGGCAAPMTGRVVEVRVAAGETVSAGATLVVLEAMKMEHQLQAHVDGVVESVRVEAGQMVDPDDILVVVKPLDEKPKDGNVD